MNIDKLKDLIYYDSQTGLFTSLINRRKVKAGELMIGYPYRGYIKVKIFNKFIPAHRLAWIYMNGEIPKGMQIDHKDGDRSNNRIENLRLATASENRQNLKAASKSNKSGFLGVYFCKEQQKYRAEIVVNGKKIRLGRYKTAEEAS